VISSKPGIFAGCVISCGFTNPLSALTYAGCQAVAAATCSYQFPGAVASYAAC